MTLTNYEWKINGEDEKGYNFILTDTLHHCDYNVVLVKDNGEVLVNDGYLNTVAPELAAAINPRLDYFMTMKKIIRHDSHNFEKKGEKKDTKKPEAKKEDKKSDSKKDDKKDKKSDSKKEDKKDDKKDKK